MVYVMFGDQGADSYALSYWSDCLKTVNRELWLNVFVTSWFSTSLRT